VWKTREGRVSEDGIAKLQPSGKLAYLTFNNAPLASFLETKISSHPLELIDLGYTKKRRGATLSANCPAG